MSIRERWLEQIREQLNESNEKSANRAAELAIAFSERAEENDVRDMMKGFLEFIEFLPGLALLTVNLTLDPRVPIAEKIKIGVLTAYLIAPTEVLLMQLIGPLAFMDDMVVIAYLIFSICALVSRLDDDVLRDNWVGKPEQVKLLADAARAITGMGFHERIMEQQI
jgi:uncharacterized membrane protein YkvA (DUF1232 family)